MINSKDLALSLRNKAMKIASDHKYTLSIEGKTFEIPADEPYTKESVFFGDNNKIGREDSSNEFQLGFYQLTVFSPRHKSNLAALDIVDTFRLGFKRGTELIENGQMTRTMESTLVTLDYPKNLTHIMYIVKINYSVIH